MRLFSPLFSTHHAAIAATRKPPLLGGAALLIAFVVAALAALVKGYSQFFDRARQVIAVGSHDMPNKFRY